MEQLEGVELAAGEGDEIVVPIYVLEFDVLV
jgi:hypothetical protein